MIKILKRLGFAKVRGRSASGLKLAYEYTLIRGDCPIGLIYPSFGKAGKIALPTREECDEESREGTACKEKKIFANNDNDIVIHERTRERFNRRTKEFVW